MAAHIRRAAARDTDTIVRILIASKEASFPDTVDNHDRDVEFWTRRWRGYITSGSRAQQSLGDGWVFLADVEGVAVGYAAYHHTTRHGTDAELQNLYVEPICSAPSPIACMPTGRERCASGTTPTAHTSASI